MGTLALALWAMLDQGGALLRWPPVNLGMWLLFWTLVLLVVGQGAQLFALLWGNGASAPDRVSPSVQRRGLPAFAGIGLLAALCGLLLLALEVWTP